MTTKRLKLRKPCKKCDKMFRPTGVATRMCNDCRKESEQRCADKIRARYNR